ncbi:unnamed protein product, partial [Ectocarpus sp. 4 AP-2014]
RGTPDQGIECLWTLADGRIHAWQVKYFFELEGSQWSNLDESVRSAITHHPSLRRYTACLPIDRSTTGEGKKWSQMRRWHSHVAKWRKWATEKGRDVSFSYWGSHELSHRLAKEEHAGRRHYWFDDETLSVQWFEEHAQETQSRAGHRFSASLNIQSDVTSVLDAVACMPGFIDRIRSSYHDVQQAWRRGSWDQIAPDRKSSYGGHLERLTEELSQITRLLDGLNSSGNTPLPLDLLS